MTHPLRYVFRDNLQLLIARDGKSVSSICRDLDINRTQFNRYKDGESWPGNPIILNKITTYFDVDANILLVPLQETHDECA